GPMGAGGEAAYGDRIPARGAVGRLRPRGPDAQGRGHERPGAQGRHQPHPREHRADREGAPGARAASRERDPHGNLLQLPTRPAASLEAVTASTPRRHRPRWGVPFGRRTSRENMVLSPYDFMWFGFATYLMLNNPVLAKELEPAMEAGLEGHGDDIAAITCSNRATYGQPGSPSGS